jgi:mannose-6-phosphate isomerase-like protein (cupin superfamily)
MRTLNRRKLLTSSAAVVAASTLPLSEAQGGPANSVGAFTVRVGEARPGGQWLVRGEKAFSTKVSGADVGKTYVAIEIDPPPGVGPELHIHLAQNELFFMLKGSIGVQCGSDCMILNVGDAFMAPANISHTFVALGTEPAHVLLVYDPAGHMEGFFEEYAPLVSVDGEPDRKKLAEVYAKHGMKVVGPPLKASSFA